MTDLLHTLPDFPTKSYTHLLPSLEKHLITTTDLLTLDALEIAKRAQLPLLDVRRLVKDVVATLQAEMRLPNENAAFDAGGGEGSLRKTGDLVKQRPTISTLSPTLDTALAGGIPTGYITEITGERYLLPFPPSQNPTLTTVSSLAAPAKPNSSSRSSSPRTLCSLPPPRQKTRL